MVDFSLNDEHNMLRDAIRDFAENEVAPVAEQLDAKEEFSYELVQKMADMNLFGLTVSEEYGGSGMDYLAYIIAVEELARVDGSTAATVAAGNSLGIGPIYYYGNDEQKKKWLPELCEGKMLGAFGLTEPNAGSDAGGTQTVAVKVGNEWVINGSKIFITNGSNDLTGYAIAQAITGKGSDGKKEYSCFIVPKGTKGFTSKQMHGKLMWRSSDTSELYFEDCRIPDSSMLGNQGDGFKQMLSTLDKGRLAIAAMGLGGAQGAYEMALKYANQRMQFGRKISKFQAVAFKLADMATEIEAARWLLYRACWLHDNDLPYAKESAMSKLYCSETMHRVVNNAVQIHGGYGLMREYNVERFYRDQKLLEIGEGTSEIQRMVISRYIGC
ncbi:MAG: acyl-CoA dehydrogenase family protein [bacterium]